MLQPGFSSVVNVGGSVGLRFGKGSDRRCLRLQAAYLFGPQLRGWAIGIGYRCDVTPRLAPEEMLRFIIGFRFLSPMLKCY